jgi:DNA-binding response OmpR family regulator
LLAEAHAERACALAAQLRCDGYDVAIASTAAHALLLARTRAPRIALVGSLGGQGDSFDLLAALCSERAPVRPGEVLGVIVLGRTAHPMEALRALERGADDHVGPSVGYLELRARIVAVLRRTSAREPAVVRVGVITIDTRTRRVEVHGTAVALRRLEFDLLLHLARDPQRVFSKHELLAAVWGYRSPGRTRTLESHVSRLRCKLEQAGAHHCLVNVWGVGYRLT